MGFNETWTGLVPTSVKVPRVLVILFCTGSLVEGTRNDSRVSGSKPLIPGSLTLSSRLNLSQVLFGPVSRGLGVKGTLDGIPRKKLEKRSSR